ncbi:MAG: glutathionylspermidine synthase family protein [bacterium]
MVRCGAPMSDETYSQVRRRTIFDCCKWDPQVEDVSVLARFPLLMEKEEWDTIARWAEELAQETLSAENELLARGDLQKELGLPRPVRGALSDFRARGSSRGAARVIRFDFHPTTEGWKISEANTDVPGGFIEATGFTQLVAAHYPGFEAAGDPSAAMSEGIAAEIGDTKNVALVFATAFSDDRQVMVFLARRLEAKGIRGHLASPEHLRWRSGRAFLETPQYSGAVELVLRFFPAEWLPNLPRACGWKNFFCGAQTPVCNPGAALMTQSKRLPLVWDRMDTPLPTWRALLPETCSPERTNWEVNGWVVKPALGRVGDSVGLNGATEPKDWKTIRKAVKKYPKHWIAQRRFDALAVESADGRAYPCIGVFTINGRVAGAYGRIGRQPLINHKAQDAAVLVRNGRH